MHPALRWANRFYKLKFHSHLNFSIMASGKETPRQKMIGMMYLVLTALLALNVSKDILDAFIVVNKGLENTNINFTEHNDQLYAAFDLAKSVDGKRVQSNWEKAQQVKKNSAELVTYIDGLQKTLVKETEGIDKSIADTLQMENIQGKDKYDTPTNIMIGDSEDGSKGESRVLKNKLDSYRTLLTGFIEPSDRKKVKVDINTDNPAHSEDNENWEMYTFSHRPLVASLTVLTKIKNDVKNAEALTVDYLLKQVDEGNLKFDTVAAKVIAQSNYVLLGEEYKADLFIAAFNKTKNPEIKVGDYNEATKTFSGTPENIHVERGLGKYAVQTTKEGIFNYSGVITMTSPKGKPVEFPFKSEYIVAKPALTVSADNMNVVYVGLENPISVSVPGIPNERLTVSVANGALKSNGNGKYMLTVPHEGKTDVNVFATMENGEKKNMGTMSFRAKTIPKPIAKIGNVVGDGKMSKNELMNILGVVAYYDNFNFNAVCKVVSFDISYPVNGTFTTKELKKNSLTPDEKTEMFSRLKRNDHVSFENIYVLGPDNKTVKISPVTIKIN